jgi:hypothetical protein
MIGLSLFGLLPGGLYVLRWATKAPDRCTECGKAARWWAEMLQILGLLAGVAIELHYGLPMSTYLLMMAISAVSIGACLLSAFAWSETWEEGGSLVGTLIIGVDLIGGFIFGTILLIAIGGAITQVLMGLI